MRTNWRKRPRMMKFDREAARNVSRTLSLYAEDRPIRVIVQDIGEEDRPTRLCLSEGDAMVLATKLAQEVNCTVVSNAGQRKESA